LRLRGFRFVSPWILISFLPNGIIAYAENLFKIPKERKCYENIR